MPSECVQRQMDRLLDGVEMHWCSVNWVVTGLVRKQTSGTGNTVFPHDDSDKRPPVATRSSTWSGTGRSFSEGL